MSCTTHQSKHTGSRVLCFECYVKRSTRQRGSSILFAPFRRVLSPREEDHRRHMLRHLQNAEGASSAQ